MPPLLSVTDLTRRFGGTVAVNAVDLSVSEGEFVSIIGPNGAGKTTLFNLMTGIDTPDSGGIQLDGRDITGLPPEKLARFGIARTFQHGRVFGNLSVLENVLVGAHTRLRAVRPNLPIVGPIAEVLLSLARPERVKNEEAALVADAREILALFGERLTPREGHRASTLSYANRRRVEIARALALRPRILMLDEPTAGMNPAETFELMEFIRALKAKRLTIVLIEHKLDLVMQLSDRVVVMDSGAKLTEGLPQTVASDPRVVEAYLGHGELGKKPILAGTEA